MGTKILVEPGNHNIADGWARKFIGEQNYKTRLLTASEFLSFLSPLNTVYFFGNPFLLNGLKRKLIPQTSITHKKE